MSLKNYYPDYPEVPYKKTQVSMDAVIAYIRRLSVSVAVKIAVYVVFRNESANGAAGVNNNYCGIQADNARWPDFLNEHIVGTTIRNENMTGNARRFLAFDSFEASVDFLADRIQDRGLYVGANCNKIVSMYIADADDFATAYWRSWVTGNAMAQVPKADKADLISMYNQGSQIFKT